MKAVWPGARLFLWVISFGVFLLGCSGCVVDRVMDSEDRRQYLDYRTESERINLEREKSGLTPHPIMSYEEWKKK